MTAADVIDVAQQAAVMGESEGATSGQFAQASSRVRGELGERRLNPTELATACFPDHTLTIVPLALALASITSSAHAAILLATNIGGDSDSVTSIAGGIAGAMNPGSVPSDWFAVVEAVNGHNLVSVAEALIVLRH